MATVTKTVDEMIDDAINRMPFLRRNLVKGKLAFNPRKRADVAAHVLVEISEDPASQVLFGAPIADGITSGAITAQTPITLDIDKIERIIEMILKYLPQILQLLKLFVSVAIFFVVSLAMSSDATAQSIETKQLGNLILNGGENVESALQRMGGDCANGTCPIRARVSAAVGLHQVAISDASTQVAPRFATSPVGPRIAEVVPVVSAVVNQARPVAAIANTRQRFRSKPVRTFLSRPLKRLTTLRR